MLGRAGNTYNKNLLSLIELCIFMKYYFYVIDLENVKNEIRTLQSDAISVW